MDELLNVRKYYLTYKTLFLNIIIALIYIISGKLGLTLAFVSPSATAIWPPTGIALVAILFFGYRVVPAIFLGAFIVNSITAGTVMTSFGIATGNTLEAIVGSYFVKRFAHGTSAFDTAVDIFKFTVLAAVLSTMVSSSIGVATLIFGGLSSWSSFWPVWITWWLGDLGGNLVIAPFLLIWGNNLWTHIDYKKSLNFFTAFLFLFIVTGIVFRGIIPYAYLCIPVVVWIAFWFGQKGTTGATIFVAFITIFYTLHGRGPFAHEETLNQSLIFLQMFLSMFSLTGLTFSAILLEIRKGEKTLAQHKERFRALIEKSFDAVVLVDATSKILYASPSVKRLLGYSPEELEGMTGFNLVAPEDRNMTIRTLAKLVLKPGGVVTVEYRAIRKDKSIIWVEATGTNLLLEPYVNAVAVNFHDITKEKEMDRAKTEFVSIASHQLRTPLTIINWYLEKIIKDSEGMSQKQQKYIQETYKAGRRMGELINALLNTSRLELGTFVVEPEKIDLAPLIDAVLKGLQQQIENKHISIEKHYQENLPPISADPNLMKIIIRNLLSNAVKYGKNQGKIMIDLTHTKKEFLLKVADDGLGIAKKQQPNIFTKLFRADNARSVVPEGTGLGLYIVKGIVTATGGNISFASEENKGTTFAISFPDPGMKEKAGEKQLQ